MIPEHVYINGNLEMIFEPKDFEYHVERCMGSEASSYFKRLLAEMEAEIKSMEESTNSDLHSYEASLESHTTAFQGILEYLFEMEECLEKQRTNKREITEKISAIRKIINNEF